MDRSTDGSHQISVSNRQYRLHRPASHAHARTHAHARECTRARAHTTQARAHSRGAHTHAHARGARAHTLALALSLAHRCTYTNTHTPLKPVPRRVRRRFEQRRRRRPVPGRRAAAPRPPIPPAGGSRYRCVPDSPSRYWRISSCPRQRRRRHPYVSAPPALQETKISAVGRGAAGRGERREPGYSGQSRHSVSHATPFSHVTASVMRHLSATQRTCIRVH